VVSLLVVGDDDERFVVRKRRKIIIFYKVNAVGVRLFGYDRKCMCGNYTCGDGEFHVVVFGAHH
jgi:hypothetical protein